LLIVASITEQVAYVYRNGICIARSGVSTGRPGHRTPTGVFTILEKEVHHTCVEIGRSGIANPQVVSPLNDRAFSALQGTDTNGHLRWVQVTAKGKEGSSESLFLAAQKSGLPPEFVTDAKQVITPGATIIFTDKPVDPTTQSHTGFQIVVAQKDKPSGTAE